MGRRLPVRAVSGSARTWWAVAAIGAAGVAGTLAIGAAMGMGTPDLVAIFWMIVAAAAVTAAVLAAVAQRLLRGASLRRRFVALPIVAAAVTAANLAVLYLRMAVNDHDSAVVVTLLCYSLAAGLAVALVLARGTTGAFTGWSIPPGRSATATSTHASAPLEAGGELDALGTTLDDMALGARGLATRERAVEQTRRDLITAVSHDLRTPLASLRAMIEARRRRCGERPAHRDPLRRRDAALRDPAARPGRRPLRARAARRRRDRGRDPPRAARRPRRLRPRGRRARGPRQGTRAHRRPGGGRRHRLLASTRTGAAEPARERRPAHPCRRHRSAPRRASRRPPRA